MNILDTIALRKTEEVKQRKQETPLHMLKEMPHYSRSCLSLKNNLLKSDTGIIAEFKRRSPSHPEINLGAQVAPVVKGYQEAGASGISVLTDSEFFGGSMEDLKTARDQVNLPLLRKDFIIDSYQIHEAKAIGADVILLIAAMLTRDQIEAFLATAKELGMEVLLEVHSEEELQMALMPGLDMIGVNNRNLKTFSVSLDNSRDLSQKIPSNYVKVSESGISDPAAIQSLRPYGYQGFLIGGNFMQQDNPGKSAQAFIQQLKDSTE